MMAKSLHRRWQKIEARKKKLADIESGLQDAVKEGLMVEVEAGKYSLTPKGEQHVRMLIGRAGGRFDDQKPQ